MGKSKMGRDTSKTKARENVLKNPSLFTKCCVGDCSYDTMDEWMIMDVNITREEISQEDHFSLLKMHIEACHPQVLGQVPAGQLSHTPPTLAPKSGGARGGVADSPPAHSSGSPSGGSPAYGSQPPQTPPTLVPKRGRRRTVFGIPHLRFNKKTGKYEPHPSVYEPGASDITSKYESQTSLYDQVYEPRRRHAAAAARCQFTGG